MQKNNEMKSNKKFGNAIYLNRKAALNKNKIGNWKSHTIPLDPPKQHYSLHSRLLKLGIVALLTANKTKNIYTINLEDKSKVRIKKIEHEHKKIQ